jgi:hypothetical protein
LGFSPGLERARATYALARSGFEEIFKRAEKLRKQLPGPDQHER